LQRLSEQNENLFKEKEALRLKHDDALHEIAMLQEAVTSNDLNNEDNDRLKLMVENYKSEIIALQTESIMLREELKAFHAQKNDEELAQIKKEQADNTKISAIKQLVKEKNDALTELDELKILYETTKKSLIAKEKESELKEKKIVSLNEELETNKDRYFQQNERNENRINELNKKLKLSKDELMVEYEKKEQQFIQTVEEQLKYIDELENENQEFQTNHTRQLSDYNRDQMQSDQAMTSLLTFKTQKNIFDHKSEEPEAHNLEDHNYHNQQYSYSDGSVSFDVDYDEEQEYDNAFTPISPGKSFDDEPDHQPLVVSHKSTYSATFTPNHDDMASYLDAYNTVKDQKNLEVIQQEQETKWEELRKKQDQRKKEKEKMNQLKQEQQKLNKMTLDVTQIDKSIPIEQTSIRKLGFFFHKKGRLLPLSMEKSTKDKEEDITYNKMLSMSIDEYTLEQLKSAITIYLFDLLLKYYKFKPKQIGKPKDNKNKNKKNKQIVMDYKYKTLLFSSNFNKAETIFVILPPFRAGIVYWNLCIDQGIVYGTMLPYIEYIMKQNKDGRNVV